MLFSKKRQLYICEDCSFEFKLDDRHPKRRIFISYGHDENSIIAWQLKKDLESRGYEAWFDIDRLKTGGDWEKYIEEGLDWVSEMPEEGRFVLLMTPYSVRRPDGYCLNELARALQRRLKIIPVMVANSEVPTSIMHKKWLDIQDCVPLSKNLDKYKIKFELLIKALEEKSVENNVSHTANDSTVEQSQNAGLTAAQNIGRPTFRRVFIGYGGHEQLSLVERIKSDLKARGHEVWFDKDRINGDDKERYIEEGIQWLSEMPETGRFILIMAPNTVRRPDGVCLNETIIISQKRIPIIPIMVSWCEPPLSICRIQWLDMQDCVPVGQKQERYYVKFERLIEALENDSIDIEGVQSRLLHILDPIPFDADIAHHILKFTGRKCLFSKIGDWLNDESASKIFWISGGPGSGKSALSSWLGYYWPEVAAFHLCKEGNAQKSDIKRCIMSVAYQLSTQLPEYQAKLNMLNLEELIQLHSTDELFDELIIKPLSGIYRNKKMIVIIDSIDEAVHENENGLSELLSLKVSRTPGWLRFVITSRPDKWVNRLIKGNRQYSLDPGSIENQNDIHDYVYSVLKPLLNDGQAIKAAETIIKKSEGVFLYAECACNDILNGSISIDRPDDFPKSLGGAYVQYFKRQFPDINYYKGKMRQALEAVVASQEPLSIKNAAEIYGKPEKEMEDTYYALDPLFTISEGIIKPFHSSIIDWLAYSDRAGQYFVSIKKGHERFAVYGMEQYNKGIGEMSGYFKAYLPAHLIALGKWDDVNSILRDPQYISSPNIGILKIKKYWESLEKISPYKMVDAYKEYLDAPEKHELPLMIRIGVLLFVCGHEEDALKLFDRLKGQYNNVENIPDLKSLSIMIETAKNNK